MDMPMEIDRYIILHNAPVGFTIQMFAPPVSSASSRAAANADRVRRTYGYGYIYTHLYITSI